MATTDRYRNSQALLERACAVIPGGIHLSGRPLLDPSRSPMYFTRGSGCRLWDADGHEYVDYLMAYGAFLLGYANEEVDRAVVEQAKHGNLLSLNHPMHARFAEALVARFPAAEMAMFFRTGSEATTAALRIARRSTQRRKVVRCGYHGWHDWCLPEDDFVPAGLRDQVLSFDVRNPSSLAALFSAHPGEIAAVILAPEMLLPLRREVLVELMEHTKRAGAVFVLDEVKTAFRTRPGSIQQLLDVAPDITTLSKGLSNGWPVAALVGKRAVLESAAGMHVSATYHGETTAMAAALKTMEIVDRDHVQDHVHRLGERLIDGLNTAAARSDVPAKAYGEPLPPMPFLAFTHPDPAINDRVKGAFYEEVLARGVLLHPRHMWFVSASHTDEDIDYTLAVAEDAFAKAREQLVKR